VILIGVDHRFVDTGKPHEEIESSGDDANHFDKTYFGKGYRWHLPDLAGSERSYAMARDAFASNGRQIIDATVDGALSVFPKMSLEDALR
jgi:hypothetical protein